MNAAEQVMQELGAQRNERLARHTFVQVGGPADWFVVARDRCQLINAVSAARELLVPLHVLGAGSNVLIRDGGIRGLVIKNDSRGCSLAPETHADPAARIIELDSGVRFASAARATARAGLTGLEWAAGIPGAVGGGLPTNAGAYGGELADILVSAQALTPVGEEVTLYPSDLELDYRDSSLRSGTHAGLVVTGLRFRLHRADPETALAEIDRVERLRKANAPTGPSLGSTFKNPDSDPRSAGQLIDATGLRGHRIGAAQISTQHANYILNQDVARASATDFMSMIEYIQTRVHERFGVRLEPEIALLGEELP